MKVAAIDIGSNSLHLAISRLFAPGVREVLDREREMLQLGRSTFRTGGIPPAEMSRAMAVLKRYRAIAEAHGVEAVLAVATSAVREAKNRKEFVARAEKEARLSVRVLDGEEEGQLIYAGVRDGLPPALRRVAVIDIGGGSVEVVVGDGSSVVTARCLKLGVLRLAERFRGQGEKTIRAMEKHIREEIGPAAQEVARAGVDAVIGTSGTILALAELLGVREEGQSLGREALEDLSGRLLSSSARELREMAPVGDSRVDTIGPGALLLSVFMEEAEVQELQSCERALREGVVADYAGRQTGRLEVHPEELSDPRRRSIHFLARRLGALDRHAEQTVRLSLRLFDVLVPIHGLDLRDRELLEYAALLHDAGYWIGAEKHHKHAYYLIEEGPLEGFSREERRVIALVARYHRGRLPRLRHAEYAKLPAGTREQVCALAALLRIADGLDRSHAGLVKDVTAAMDGEAVTLNLHAQGDLELELYAAERRADLFRKVFDRELHFKIKKNGTR